MNLGAAFMETLMISRYDPIATLENSAKAHSHLSSLLLTHAAMYAISWLVLER